MSRPLDVVEMDGKEGRVSRKGPDLHTPRRDAFRAVSQDPSTFVTTTEFAREFKVTDKQVHRWCSRWYGPLPIARGRGGKSMGYRIHPFMRRVARGWLQTQDVVVREAIRRVLMDRAGEGGDWVMVVGEVGSLHYTPGEVLVEMQKVLLRAAGNRRQVSVVYVGDAATGSGEEH